MKKTLKYLFIFGFLVTCSQNTVEPNTAQENEISSDPRTVSVIVDGVANNYTFQVGVRSPDTGCDQYADWWEVVSLQGDLLYRRILTHSHVNEQPFVRSGGPVEIDANETVFVRVHISNSGYSINGSVGSVAGGFTGKTFIEGFAANLENIAPQPNGCDF